jgi:arylsulfatase A-like enzyme
MNKPNVLLLTIDSLRADILGCYGYDAGISPNIDKLAANGIRFTQAITGGSWTQAAFPPLMTSTYASMYGGCLGLLSPDRPSPIQALATHGYTTAGFSTSPHLSKATGYDRGFHYFVDLEPAEIDPWLRRIKGGQHLLRSPLLHYLLRLVGQRIRPARLYVSAAEVTNRILDRLNGLRQPFYAWAHYMDVHWPYHLEETLTHPQEIAQAWKDLAHMYGANWKGVPVTSAQKDHYRRLYEQAIRYTDAQIGRLLDCLDRSGQLSNTVIILVSDHGEEFLERGHWGHFERNLHDEILRVPLIIRLPGSTSGHVVQQVRTLDLMPTVLELTGCPPLAGLEGASLIPLWMQSDAIYSVQIAISEMWRDHRHIVAARTEAFNYIWDSRDPDQSELYDLHADPGERHNVRDLYPEKARQFQAHIDAHLQRVAAQETTPANFDAKPDAELLRRLRDLGYVE